MDHPDFRPDFTIADWSAEAGMFIGGMVGMPEAGAARAAPGLWRWFKGLFRGGADDGAGRLLNVFGEREAPRFLDVATDAAFANGRTLTQSLKSGRAAEVLIRNAPLTGKDTVSEIIRLVAPGGRITVVQPAAGFQGNILLRALGSRASVISDRTFVSAFTGQEGVFVRVLQIRVGP
jgi:hypothetical protein